MDLDAKPILECNIERPALAYESCDICSEKQRNGFISVRPVNGCIEQICLCGKCANRLVWILPRLLRQLRRLADER